MLTITITCPHCGFAKDTPKKRLPQRDVPVTCPRCKQGFPLSLGMKAMQEPPARPEPPASVIPPVQPTPEQYRNPSIAELPMEQGGERAKRLLLFFVLLIVLLVGVRLWADGKKRDVPFPNFIAISDREVAVNWGQDIYVLDHSGKVLRKQSLPEEIIPTQLKYVGDELWIGDYAGKTIKRFRNGNLETVINGNGRFHGAFKFAADLQSGQIFVTDASNHKVHIFAADGTYQSSFGLEGKGLAELMFPNTVVFDAKGRLLIVNTNAQRLDIYERDGEFIEPFARVKPQDAYRFPTLLAQAGDRLAFLLTVDLREAKAVMYGSDGKLIGELKPPKPLLESGDIAALDGKVILTDNKERRVYSFAADTLAYLGPFSAELDALGDKALKQESLYANLANSALGLLIATFLPVFILFLRLRRNTLRSIAATDYSGLIPEKTLLTVGLNRRRFISGVLMLLLSLITLLGLWFGLTESPLYSLLLVIAAGAIAFTGWLQFFIRSGYADPAREKALVRLVKALYGKISLMLLPEERVEVCTAARLNLFNNQIALLLCTNRRLLIVDLSVRASGIRQIGYADIADLALGPATTSSHLLTRMLKNNAFSLHLKLDVQAATTLTGRDQQLLERLRQFLESKRSSGERLGVTVLCDTCFRPTGDSGCPVCSAGKKENWKPLILSLIYPGLGQFYNRELVRGTLLSTFFSAGIISSTMPVIKMVDRSAEFTSIDVNFVAQNIAGLLFLYTVSCLDADQLGRKGRKLFSAATGIALTGWLEAQIARLQPFRRKLLIELVPGVAHALAGSYQRAVLFSVPTGYLFWMVCWSLLSIVSGHEGTLDFYIFGYGSALVAILWVCMNVDGIRRFERLQPLKITGRGVLSTFGLPCLTFVAALIAQFVQEKVLFADPMLRRTIRSFFRQLHSLVFGQVGYAGFDAMMFLGWGGAIMALFASIAWQSGKGGGNICKAALGGLCGGIVCWTICASLLGGVLGSLVLIPVAFGLTIGLLAFLYFRNDGTSSLLIPAIMAGTVIGNAVTILSIGLIFSANKLLIGTNVSVIFSVALPAYFMHLAHQVVTKLLVGARRECFGH